MSAAVVEPLERPVGRITALEPDPRRPGAVRIHVAGRVYCTVDSAVALAERLAVGGEIGEAQHERLARAADDEAAYRTVLRALGQRAYATADLARRLVRKGHPRDAVNRALARVQEQGLLDDAAYAEHYVRTRSARGRGPSRLRTDLLARGVDRALIDRAIVEQWPDGPDLAAARALAERRARQLGSLERGAKRRRLLTYLARRGYTGYEVAAIVAELVG